MTSFDDDDKADKLPASLEFDDVKDFLAFLFDVPVILLGDGHKHWQMSEARLSQLSTRGKRAYKSLTKGNRKSALVKTVEQHLPVLLFLGLLLTIIIPRIRESQQRIKVDAKLKQSDARRGGHAKGAGLYESVAPAEAARAGRNVGANGADVADASGSVNDDEDRRSDSRDSAEASQFIF